MTWACSSGDVARRSTRSSILAQRIVFRGGAPEARVVIDADGYRERREETLRSLAADAAEESLRSGEAIELDPMPASERRIVHEYLRERGGVETHSEGDEPERYLVVEPGGTDASRAAYGAAHR